MLVQAENKVHGAGEIVLNEIKVSSDYKRNIDRLADAELNQPGITQQTTNDINAIKVTAKGLLEASGTNLVESMQAVVDTCCS